MNTQKIIQKREQDLNKLKETVESLKVSILRRKHSIQYMYSRHVHVNVNILYNKYAE